MLCAAALGNSMRDNQRVADPIAQLFRNVRTEDRMNIIEDVAAGKSEVSPPYR